jgi:hypothetical protein
MKMAEQRAEVERLREVATALWGELNPKRIALNTHDQATKAVKNEIEAILEKGLPYPPVQEQTYLRMQGERHAILTSMQEAWERFDTAKAQFLAAKAKLDEWEAVVFAEA